MRTSCIHQSELDRQVARATGESRSTIRSLGFVPLSPVPYERDRQPLIVDWDELEQRRRTGVEL